MKAKGDDQTDFINWLLIKNLLVGVMFSPTGENAVVGLNL